MNIKERATVVRATDTLVHCINDESIIAHWLTFGVADGDINDSTTDEELSDYCDDNTFAELMQDFLYCMRQAYHSGGLYCDGIKSYK